MSLGQKPEEVGTRVSLKIGYAVFRIGGKGELVNERIMVSRPVDSQAEAEKRAAHMAEHGGGYDENTFHVSNPNYEPDIRPYYFEVSKIFYNDEPTKF